MYEPFQNDYIFLVCLKCILDTELIHAWGGHYQVKTNRGDCTVNPRCAKKTIFSSSESARLLVSGQQP